MKHASIVTVIMLTYSQAAVCADRDEGQRIVADQAFLKSNTELRVEPRYVSKTGIFHCAIHVDPQLFRSHVETRANIKVKSGKTVLSFPLQYTGERSKTLNIQFSPDDVSGASELELKFRQRNRIVTFVIPFTVLRDAEGYWIVD